MTVVNVTDAILKGDVSGPTFTGQVDGSKFSGSITYADTTTPPEPPGGGVTPPSTGGWPDANNTGPTKGLTLKDSGPVEAKTDGQVVKNLKITGYVLIKARNVTVQDCEIDASGGLYGVGCEGDGSADLNYKVVRCKIYGKGRNGQRDADHVLHGVFGGAEVSFCDIFGCENGVTQAQADLYMHDNYIHDFANWPSEHDDHTDGVQTYGWAGSGGLRIIHNTISGFDTCGEITPADKRVASSCIALSQDQHDLTIDNNLMIGGTYCMYGNAQAGGQPRNTKVTNNHFSNKYSSKCGEYGPAFRLCSECAGICLDRQHC